MPRAHSPFADEAKVIALLTQTRSVSLTARMLDVSVPRLSTWLHRQKRREWWEKTKAAWSADARRERQRRYRSRRAARDGRKITPRKRKPRARAAAPCPVCGRR